MDVKTISNRIYCSVKSRQNLRIFLAFKFRENELFLEIYASPFDPFTAQKVKFSIKDFFSKCNQIYNLLRIWSYLLKKSLLETFILCSTFLLKMFQCSHSSYCRITGEGIPANICLSKK